MRSNYSEGEALPGGPDVSSDEYENELVEVDDISQSGFLEAP